MFLMNAPPVVALQSPWEAFGPPGSFRFPCCFSESEGDATRASVGARVRMVISTLRHDGAALGTSDAHAVQRGPRAERGRDARLAANPAVRKEQPAFAACAVAADCDPPGERGATGLGPEGLDSDSDDSVDRDIEQAIQEYLRAKSGAAQPASREPQCCPPEPAHSSPTPTLCPPKLAPGSGGAPGSLVGASEDQGSASPVSMSSEDSFEQSIQAEIEQFLNEKRQHGSPKRDEPVGKKTDPNENPARGKPDREPPARATLPQALMGACKEFVFRKPPRAAKVSPQLRSFRPKVTMEPGSVGSSRPVAAKPEAAQSRGGARRVAGVSRRSRRIRSAALVHEASDSSSDDGIEAAIQLYQLEKTRKEAAGDPPPRAQLREEKGPGPPTSSASSTTQSASQEAHKRAPSKKKPATPRAMDPTPGALNPDRTSKLPKDPKASAPPRHTATSSESVDRASCRADTSAELMCAEAILDISKTILPAPEAGSERPPSVSPLFPSPAAPSRSDSDNSSVDSDDSIEQEIRKFLALKAQAGSPQPAQGPLSPPGPNSQTGVPKAPPCKTPDLPLSCRRKRRGGVSSTVRPSTPKKREVRESTQEDDHSRAKAQPGPDDAPPSQGKASEAPAGEGEARAQPVPSRTVGLGDIHVSQGQGGHGKAENRRNVSEKESSEDKSSSLDSDEDLDTAIKDLLRSKRKPKKRGRDPRAVGRKKVRFSSTETRFMDKPGGLPRDSRDRSPQVLRSCLSKSRRDSRDGPGRGPPSVFSVTQRVKPGCVGSEDAASAFGARKRAPEGAAFPKDPGACTPPPSAPSLCPSSEDSSVDSDDSIELEIRKFLAEKANKASVSSSEIQGGGPPALGPGGPAKPEVLCRKELAPAPQPGVCTRSQRARGGPQPAERGGAQGAASLFVQSAKGAPRPEHTARLPAALGHSEPAPPRGAGGAVPAKGSPAARRSTHVHKDRSPRGAEPAAAESAFGQLLSNAKVDPKAGSAGGTFHMNYGGQSLLTPSPGPQADLTLPWSDFAHQSRLLSPWAVNSEGRGPAWMGGLGGESEKGAEGPARGPGKSLPFPGFSPLLSTQLFHFGKGVPWGGQQAGLFSPHPGLPPRGLAFSAFRETQASHSPVFGRPHVLPKKDGGHWPDRKAHAGVGGQDRRSSGAEDSILDLRYRHRAIDRDDQDQEALGSDASEFSDTSVEDGGGGSVAKGKVLKL